MQPIEGYLDELKNEELIFGDHLLCSGKKISDLIKKDNYEIKSLTKEGVILEHKPYFRSEQKKDIEIGYDELVKAFESDHFSIAGFMPIAEGEQKNVDALKKVILNTIKNIELAEREKEINEREEKLKEKEREKYQLRGENEDRVHTVINKKKSKKLVKAIRSEEEQKKDEAQRLIEEEAQRKSFEQEQERLAKERQKNIKLATARKISQQQRVRIIARENFKKEEDTNDVD